MVEIFKTDVQKKYQADRLLSQLSQSYPALIINFDLDDCDKILRVEGKNIKPKKIIDLMKSEGHECKVLV